MASSSSACTSSSSSSASPPPLPSALTSSSSSSSTLAPCLDLDVLREIFSFGGEGKDASQFFYPSGLCLVDDNLYVCDAKKCIQVFDVNGRWLRMFGTTGRGVGELGSPSDLQVSVSGDDVFVCDYGNDCISVFSLDGKIKRGWGKAGHGEDGVFLSPRSIALHQNELYVVDETNCRIQVFDLNGRFLRKWGSCGDGEGQFRRAHGICVVENTVYVSDSTSNFVSVFDLSGRFVRRWGCHGTMSFRSGKLHHHAASGRLFLCCEKGLDVYSLAGNLIKRLQFDSQWDPIAVCVTGDRLFVSGTDHQVHVLSSFLSKSELESSVSTSCDAKSTVITVTCLSSTSASSFSSPTSSSVPSDRF